MRILFLSNLYPPHDRGGMEQICQETVTGFQARGHVCHVLTSRYGVYDQSRVEDGITRDLYLEADVNYYRPIDFFLKRHPWERANQQALRRALELFKPDVIFIWGMWNLSRRLAHWAEEWLPGRVAYSIQDYWPMEADQHTRYWRHPSTSRAARIALWPFARLALGLLAAEQYPPRLQFQHVSCCSEYVVETLTQAGAIQPGAATILDGIDPAPFLATARQTSKEHGKIRLLYFGSLAAHKGVHTAIEALGILQQKDQTDGLQLTIVGGGHPDYEAHLHALAKSLALEERVCFSGWIPRSEIAAMLAKHDVFLFTSIYAEPFGRTIIEAMAAGLAVIGANVGGSREIFRFYPENTTFEPGNAEALAKQMRRLVDEPDLIDRLARAGQGLVLERFTLERMIDNMESFVSALIAQDSRRDG